MRKDFRDWRKWRLVYQGGQRFIENYLVTYSIREDKEDFEKRRRMTYNPAFAKEAIDEIKNNIFQRLIDITRRGGSDSYNEAIAGKDGGVDLAGSSMNAFIGRKILPELLTMSRIGIFVDMPRLDGRTLLENYNKRPYIYTYNAEDIKSWSIDDDNRSNNLTNVLLREYVYIYDDLTGLPIDTVEQYRRLWLDLDGRVRCQFYDQSGNPEPEVMILDIPKIPFYLCEISDSLLADVANYQIALLNLSSSDISYALNSNFPFYTEQYDARADSEFFRRPGLNEGGEAKDASAGKKETVNVGTTKGRKYPKDMERPGFIHPSSEPLKASMEKQEQMKAEIRLLVNLAVTNLVPKNSSAESKQIDQGGLEAGLSYIGLELEQLERKVAEFWAMYENTASATIHYPETYDIKSTEERTKETDRLTKLLPTIPSKTAQKEISKELARLNLGRKVSTETLTKIYQEIDNAPAITADPVVIASDVELGLLDLELASKIRGYPAGTVDKAKQDHTDRLERIQSAQSSSTGTNGLINPAARGIKDQDGNLAGNGVQEKKESKDTTQDPIVKDKVRGEGK